MSRKDISDLQVLQAYVDMKAIGRAKFADEILAERTGQCLKVCQRAMERAEARGLLDYGVSLRSGWLTEAGVVMHAMLTDNEAAQELLTQTIHAGGVPRPTGGTIFQNTGHANAVSPFRGDRRYWILMDELREPDPNQPKLNRQARRQHLDSLRRRRGGY